MAVTKQPAEQFFLDQNAPLIRPPLIYNERNTLCSSSDTQAQDGEWCLLSISLQDLLLRRVAGLPLVGAGVAVGVEGGG